MNNFLKWAGVVALAAAAVFVLGWLLTIVGIFGPGNVKAQWQFAYDYDQDLRAIARQACEFETLVASSSGSAKVQRESQLQAVKSNYERVRGDYDARLRDAFRGGVVHPPDVPDQAPTLLAMEAQECPRA